MKKALKAAARGTIFPYAGGIGSRWSTKPAAAPSVCAST